MYTHTGINQVPSMFELTQLVLILLLAYETLQMLRRRSCTVSQLPLYSGRPSNSLPIPRTGQIASACSKAHKRKRLTNNSDGNEGSNPKLRRTSKYHSSSCLPCALWRQSGSDNNLIQFHPLVNSRHAGKDALSISQYAAFDGVNFNLVSSDCICLPCYTDYLRNKHNRENTIPRWAKIKHVYYAQEHITKHCIFCCGNTCDCDQINQWGPDKWHGDDEISLWKQYLSLTGKVDYAIPQVIVLKHLSSHYDHTCHIGLRLQETT